MAWATAETLFKDVCRHVNESWLAIASNTNNIISTGNTLSTSTARSELDTEGRAALDAALKAERDSLAAAAARWADMMDRALAAFGLNLTRPSRYLQGTRVLNRRELLREIQEDMFANSRSCVRRQRTYAADPAADANGIVQCISYDKNGQVIEAGLGNQTLDVEVTGTRATGLGYWASEVTIRPRNKGADIFSLIGPAGELKLRAVNDVDQPYNLLTNPTLQNANTTTADADVTSLSGWTLSSPSGSPTHKIDATNVYRSLTTAHKIYGNSTTRRFEQQLNIRQDNRRRAHKFKLSVYKTGTPTGNITLTWGSKSQTWTYASLSAGWNELIIDSDTDVYPDNFDTSGAVLRVDFATTGGSDASNYVTFGLIVGTVGAVFDGPQYLHFGHNGQAQLGNLKSYAHTMTSAGKNLTALYLAYHQTADKDYAWLPSSATPTLADYT